VVEFALLIPDGLYGRLLPRLDVMIERFDLECRVQRITTPVLPGETELNGTSLVDRSGFQEPEE